MSFKLLGISGSLRKGATNRKLLNEAVRVFGPCEFKQADLLLPLYDGDVEDAQGIPAIVQQLADQIADADAVVISTPEYNKAMSGVLKNALDWVSRCNGNPWRDKPGAVMSAAAGRAGGERAQFSLRLAMVPFRARIVPGPEMMLANSREAFYDTGQLKDERAMKTLTELMAGLQSEIAR